MAWVTLAKGTSLDEFRRSQPPVSELPKGTKMRLEIETPWWAPIAPLADLFGAEWVAQRLWAEGGAIVTDVEGVGWHKIIVHMESDPAWVIPLIFVVCGVLISWAWAISAIRLGADIPSMVKWGAIAVIALAVAIALGYLRQPAKEAVST